MVRGGKAETKRNGNEKNHSNKVLSSNAFAKPRTRTRSLANALTFTMKSMRPVRVSLQRLKSPTLNSASSTAFPADMKGVYI